MGKMLIVSAVVLTVCALILFAWGKDVVFFKYTAVAMLCLSILIGVSGGIIRLANMMKEKRSRFKDSGRPIDID